jgi:hypothetical protein
MRAEEESDWRLWTLQAQQLQLLVLPPLPLRFWMLLLLPLRWLPMLLRLLPDNDSSVGPVTDAAAELQAV